MKLNEADIEKIKYYLNVVFGKKIETTSSISNKAEEYAPDFLLGTRKGRLSKTQKNPEESLGQKLKKANGHHILETTKIMLYCGIICQVDEFVQAIFETEDEELIKLYNFSQEYYLQEEYNQATGGSYKELLGKQINIIRSRELKTTKIIIETKGTLADMLGFQNTIKASLMKTGKTLKDIVEEVDNELERKN